MTKTLSGPMLPPRSGQAKHLLVLLHGYGSDGADLIALGQYWSPLLPDTMFVSPNAPDACAINPGGYEWFPLQTDRVISRVEGAPAAREVIVNFLIDLGPDRSQAEGHHPRRLLAGRHDGAPYRPVARRRGC